jgi:16S rRNA (cytosine1402-N4)-methyltransferase
MLAEAIAALVVAPQGRYVDATFGRGGHSRALLAALGPRAAVLAIDRDPAAIVAAREIHDERFSAVHGAFADVDQILAAAGWDRVDGILLDLGVSSPQLDEPSRGFSFRADAPLDMRMDTTRGPTAAQWLAECSEEDLRKVISEYGEERFARSIAKQVAAARRERPIASTGELAAIVGSAVRTREPGQDPATRTFQAIRIHINQELAQLSIALPKMRDALLPGGRLVVIAFHSLEDRIVKRFIQGEANPAADMPLLPLRAAELPQPTMRRLGGAVRASAAEIAANPRARSAVLRVAERIGPSLANAGPER